MVNNADQQPSSSTTMLPLTETQSTAGNKPPCTRTLISVEDKNNAEDDEDIYDQPDDHDDLPEGIVDDDDDNGENDDEDDDDDDEAPYEVDADDEQSNDMLDDGTEDDDDNGPKSTSPAPLSLSNITNHNLVTKIDLHKPVVQVISMKVNNNNNNNNINDDKVINFKTKEFNVQAPESEDSAADVSYERTSDNETDIEDTTITTVNTNNPNNIDLKELNYEQRFKITQSIWYLPHINRATVVHYLQGKTVGVFIVSIA